MDESEGTSRLVAALATAHRIDAIRDGASVSGPRAPDLLQLSDAVATLMPLYLAAAAYVDFEGNPWYDDEGVRHGLEEAYNLLVRTLRDIRGEMPVKAPNRNVKRVKTK